MSGEKTANGNGNSEDSNTTATVTTVPVEISPDTNIELDIDDLELAKALDEAKAEEKGGDPQDGATELETDPKEAAAKGNEDPEPSATEVKAGEENVEPKPAQVVPNMVPIERLNQVLDRNREQDQKIAYLSGKIEQMSEQAKTQSAPNSDPEPTPQERIDSARAKRSDAYKRYDEGELGSLSEVNKIVDEADEEIRAATVELFKTTSKPDQTPIPAPSASLSFTDQMLLEHQMKELEKHSTYLDHMSESQVEHLKQMARDEAMLMGNPITPDTGGTYRLREAVVRLSNAVGPKLFPNVTRPTAQTPKTTPKADDNPRKELKAIEAARLAKIGQAQNAPPDPNKIGTAAHGGGKIAESKVEELSDIELEDMDPAVLESLLN